MLIHPTPGSVFRIDWQVPDDVELDAEEYCGTLDQRIRAIIGPDADYEIVWKSIYTFHGRRANRGYRPGGYSWRATVPTSWRRLGPGA